LFVCLLQRVTVDTTDVLGVELYDHRGDPGELDWAGEHRNVQGDPNNAQVLAKLRQMIHDYIRLI
jgi:hypothetical protein